MNRDAMKDGRWRRMRRRWLAALLGLLLIVIWLAYEYARPVWHPWLVRARGRRTVEDVVRKMGPAAEARLRPFFERASVAYPPRRIAILAFKNEKMLELWAENESAWVFVRTYPILAASGHAGPKLREGDRQVPEGIYRICGLNPNSAYHLSLQIDYPNEQDWEEALGDGGSDDLGGDIFIHGKAMSIGCIAVGDEAVEELFVLVARIGCRQVKVIIAPNDLRGGRAAATHPANPPWTERLHQTIRKELAAFEAK